MPKLIEDSETYQPKVKPLIAPFCYHRAMHEGAPDLVAPPPSGNFLDLPLVLIVQVNPSKILCQDNITFKHINLPV